jgi:SAM-dependent methyltransferase
MDMFEYIRNVIFEIEKKSTDISPQDILYSLRKTLGLGDFGEIMFSLPLKSYENISKHLPSMASEEIQNKWTGSSGVALLKQTCSFVRSVAYNYTKITGKSLENASILDYGCGYGRIARLMYYFTSPDRLMGVDPWDRSIDICHANGLGSLFRVSDYLPDDLPVDGRTFDFIYAFSVFTHLSERATLKALAASRRYINPAGVMVITIRPVEYWNFNQQAIGASNVAPLEARHRSDGFAFSPHNRAPVDGDVTYGDTSMTTNWISANVPGWKIAGIDRSIDDSLQIYVFLLPV